MCTLIPARHRVDSFLFFFNDTATTEIYTLSLHDPLPILERVEVEMLVAVGEVRTGHARRRALAGEIDLDPHLAALRAEAADHPVELAVALQPRLVAAEAPGLLRESLQRDAFDLRGRVDKQL